MFKKTSATDSGNSEMTSRHQKDAGFSSFILSIFGRRNKTMRQRLLTGTAVILIVQYITIFACLLFTGLFSSVRSGYIAAFNQDNHDISNHIQSQMASSWSDLTALQDEIKNVFHEESKPSDNVTLNEPTGNKILKKASEHLLRTMDRNKVSAGFIILNKLDGVEAGAGLYIKNTSGQESEIVELGDFEANIFNERLQSEKADTTLREMGYWSESLKLGESSEMMMTYTEPLLDSKGEIYGAVGVEVSRQDVLASLINDLEGDEKTLYSIAIKNGEQEYKNIVAIGSRYYEYCLDNPKLVLAEKEDDAQTYILEQRSSTGERVIANIQPILLNSDRANENNENAEWAVLGIAPQKMVLKPYNDMLGKLSISILISGVFACVGMLLIISAVSSPIIKLCETLQEVDTNTILQFEKTNIIEIDQLAIAAQQMSRRTREANMNLSQVFKLSNLEIGVFEYHKVTGELYITDRLMELIGSEERVDRSVKETLQKRFVFLRENCVEQNNGDAVIYKYYNEKQGLFNWIKLSVTDNGDTTMGVVTNVTKEMFDMRKLEYERDYDSMTSLMSRRAFHTTLANLFLDKDKIKIGAMIMFDLDNLKHMNDTFGHDSGDKYIVCMAQAIKQSLPPEAILSRISGDEFYAFIYGYESKNEVRKIIATLKKSISMAEMTLPSGEKYPLRASGGIAWYPDDAEGYENLLKYSDFAMYQVKNATKGEIGEFDSDRYEKESFLTEKSEELNFVIEGNLVDYHFQPIVNAQTGEVFAYEALMRGRMEDLKNPQEILSIAKTQAKLYQIERLTWRSALDFFDKTSAAEGDCKIFINSIASEALSKDDVSWIEERYKKYLDRVVIELTEEEKSGLECVEAKRQVVKKWGAQIAIDDFGTGYNGEAILLELQPDLIKTDMTIIRGIEADPRRQIILQNLLYYARRQDIKVIAEGVETYGEMKMLIESGVDYLQGYYLGKPNALTNEVSGEVKAEILKINKEKSQATI